MVNFGKTRQNVIFCAPGKNADNLGYNDQKSFLFDLNFKNTKTPPELLMNPDGDLLLIKI